VIRAGIRAGNLPEILNHVVQADRQSRLLGREIRIALAYPLLLCGLTALLVLFVAFMVLPQMEQIFNDFDTELALPTKIALGMGRVAQWLWNSPVFWVIAAIVGILLVAFIVLRLVEWLSWSAGGTAVQRSAAGFFASLSRRRTRLMVWPARMLSTAPVIGPLLLWHAVAEWARLLAMLIDCRVPLPEALKLSAQGVRSANLADLAARLAEGVQQGRGLADLMYGSRWLPASLVPITAWGEQNGQLADALRTAAEMFAGRVRLRASLIKQVAPPVLFIVVAAVVAFLIAAMFAPLVSLIQNLQ
jgi:type IV pilus assembly protein PilC